MHVDCLGCRHKTTSPPPHLRQHPTSVAATKHPQATFLDLIDHRADLVRAGLLLLLQIVNMFDLRKELAHKTRAQPPGSMLQKNRPPSRLGDRLIILPYLLLSPTRRRQRHHCIDPGLYRRLRAHHRHLLHRPRDTSNYRHLPARRLDHDFHQPRPFPLAQKLILPAKNGKHQPMRSALDAKPGLPFQTLHIQLPILPQRRLHHRKNSLHNLIHLFSFYIT